MCDRNQWGAIGSVKVTDYACYLAEFYMFPLKNSFATNETSLLHRKILGLNLKYVIFLASNKYVL